MLNLKAIPFVAGMMIDVADELHDLDAAIAAKDADEVRHQYNHISSLLTGISYVVGYTSGDEKAEVIEQIEELKDLLESRWLEGMDICWSAKLQKPVHVIAYYHADGTKTYELVIDGATTEYKDRSAAIAYLKAQAA